MIRCVRQSLTSLLFWKVNNMSTKCPTCSLSALKGVIPKVKPDIRGSRERPRGEPVSRNVNELDSASLHYVGVASLPELVKPVIADEETLQSSQRTPRGDWRQHAGKEKSRNLRDPSRPAMLAARCGVGPSRPGRESEGIVVAGKQGNSCGAKGSHCKRETINRSAPACHRLLRDKTVRSKKWNRSQKW